MKTTLDQTQRAQTRKNGGRNAPSRSEKRQFTIDLAGWGVSTSDCIDAPRMYGSTVPRRGATFVKVLVAEIQLLPGAAEGE